MKNYNRIMLGRKSALAEECYKGNILGADFDIQQDLSDQLEEDPRMRWTLKVVKNIELCRYHISFQLSEV